MNKKEETFLPPDGLGQGEGSYHGTRGGCMDAWTGPPRPEGAALLPPGVFPQVDPTGSQGAGRVVGSLVAWSWGVGNAWKEAPGEWRRAQASAAALLAAAPRLSLGNGGPACSGEFCSDRES